MAGADYYSCDVCGSKTFYDANLDWRDGTRETGWEDWLPNVGAMKVICKSVDIFVLIVLVADSFQ